jgi:glucosamine-6-phosphate deaminase
LLPLGADLQYMFPFRDLAACTAVRELPRDQITRREPHHHPDFHLKVIPTAAELYQSFAEDMLQSIQTAAAEGRPYVGIFPVGPVAQYPLLARRILETGTSLDHCRLFFLDEYAYEDGRTIDKSSPWSFEFTVRGRLFDPLEAAGVRPEQLHFPGPDNIERYDEMILEASDGRGADVVYGGVGWAGHFAFWDPHLAEEFATEEDWRKGHSALVRLHPMTVLQNCLRGGGDWSLLPSCAYTVGPAAILGAQRRCFYLDALLGPGISWQRFVGRLATHGPVTPHIPASYLQTAPGTVTFLEDLTEEIGAPRYVDTQPAGGARPNAS